MFILLILHSKVVGMFKVLNMLYHTYHLWLYQQPIQPKQR